MTKTGLLVALVAAACSPAVAAAQERGKIQPGSAQQRGKIEPGEASGLKKRSVLLDKGISVSAAEKAYAMTRLENISRIVLKAVPEFGHLKYPIWEAFSGFFGAAPKPNTVLDYKYELVVDLGGRGLCVIMEADINHDTHGISDGNNAIVEAILGKPVPGSEVVWAKMVPPPDPSYEQIIFARDGGSPWIQLTREEFRRWQIVELEGSSGEKRAAYKKLIEKTPYERFMAEAPERKKTRDDVAAALKGARTPAEIAALIKEMEDGEREAAAQLKGQDAEERKRNDSLSRAPTVADLARRSIDRMTPAERKLPAFIVHGASDTLFQFGTADSTYVSRAVRQNTPFWIMRRSRAEVHSIKVGFYAACPKEPPPPEVHAALWKLRQNIDWAALKQMVNQP